MAWIECKMGNIDAIVKNVSWYATCGTAQGTTAKVATTTDSKFALVTGAKVTVKFTYSNTATNPTLNVDSKGAKYIKAYGTTAPTKWWEAGDVVEFTYDGTNWIMSPTMGMRVALKYGTTSDDSFSGASWHIASNKITISEKGYYLIVIKAVGKDGNAQVNITGKGTSLSQYLSGGIYLSMERFDNATDIQAYIFGQGNIYSTIEAFRLGD